MTEVFNKYIRPAISFLLPQYIKNIGHRLISIVANIKYSHPSKELTVIGITGTDGKTSTATMLYEILQEAGKKVGLVSTISAKVGEKEYPTGFHITTPDPDPLRKFLREMVDEGLEYVILETTSHGLHQGRVYGIQYDYAVFTNITNEHLDYHKTYDRYVKAKSQLIRQLAPNGVVILNRDDQSYVPLHRVALRKKVKELAYGLTALSDIFASDLNQEVSKTDFTTNFRGNEYKNTIHMPGQYNVYNALAATATALSIGVEEQDIRKGLEELKNIEGRWDVIQEKPIKVVVDFAHTPNSLHNVLKYAQEENGKGKLTVVFGAAGQRDKDKRPAMGEAAGTFADKIVLTAEDPRGESIVSINQEISTGFKKYSKVEGKDYFSIEDRGGAIKFAISSAKPGDTVIITGKGHEKSLNIDGKTEMPWSDHDVAQKVLDELKSGEGNL